MKQKPRPKDIVESLWRAGVAAVNGEYVVGQALQEDGVRQIEYLVAVGKAAQAMYRGAQGFLCAQSKGLLITKYGHIHQPDRLPKSIQVIESAHPVPDENSLFAGRRLLAFIESIPQTATLVMLVSGGASALAELLPANMELHELRQVTHRLIADGYNIDQINQLRCRLSRIKDGQLLQNFRGRRALVYAISDVPTDDIGVIGSGIGNNRAILVDDAAVLPVARSIRPIFDKIRQTRRPPVNATGFHYRGRVIASSRLARAAVARQAARQGYRVIVNHDLNRQLPDQEIARVAETIARQLGHQGQSGIYIWGVEPTINLPDNPGCGGRNQHLALLLASAVSGMDNIAVIVAGTDGTDGPTPYAGAIVDGKTWSPQAQQALREADSGAFLKQRRALFHSGPTGTNVMDLVVALKA